MAFLRKRDVGILAISCLSILFSFQQYSGISFHENWVHPIDRNLYKNKHYPAKHERLPNPVITDLEGDGLNEIVFVTPDYRIRVVDTIYARNTTNSFSTFPFKAETTLFPSVKVTEGRWPVALATGYLTPYKQGETRQQVVVVVTNGWNVLCFSSSLKLLWETNAVETMPVNVYHKEIAVIVSPGTIRVGDKGTVIVGGSLWPKGSGQDHAGHVHDNDETSTSEEEYHFSYYAFDGRTGASRWKHEQGDFESHGVHEGASEEYLPEHSLKLHMLSVTKHMGEVDWREFKSYIAKQLPHRWRVREDTNFQVAHFEKKRKMGGGSVADAEWTVEDVGLSHEHISGLPGGGMAPHSAADHVTKPNVVISHIRDGIEVIHLFTGRPVCRLGLQKGTYMDINGDGIIDRLQAFGSHVSAPKHGEDPVECTAIAMTGIPALDQLFNGTICLSSSSGAFGMLFSDVTSVDKEVAVDTTTPVVIESVHNKGYLLDPSKHEYDSIFLINTGTMTSYRPSGKRNWQLETPASWPSRHVILENKKGKAPTVMVGPFLEVFTIEEFGHEKFILAVGESVAMVSASGVLLSTLTPPDTIISPPVIADFNNDGLNDLIIVTSKGIYGYTLTRTTGSVILPVLSSFMLIAIAILFVYVNYNPTEKKKRNGKKIRIIVHI